ncbi:MAG: tetratricopeptide repeat protein [Betaproteobacteria bacterium]
MPQRSGGWRARASVGRVVLALLVEHCAGGPRVRPRRGRARAGRRGGGFSQPLQDPPRQGGARAAPRPLRCRQRQRGTRIDDGAPNGDVGLIIDALGDAAAGLLVTGRESEGLTVFTEASILARSASDEARLGSIMGGLGEVHRSRGDVVAAEQAYREALRLSRSCHDQRTTGVTLANLARLLIATDRPAEAKALLGECMSLQASRANKEMVHCSLDAVAALASALDDHPTAARFHGAMERTMHESRTRRDPVDEAFSAPRIARSRAALGEAAFDAATAAGWALSYDAATAELGQWLARGDAAGGTLAA